MPEEWRIIQNLKKKGHRKDIVAAPRPCAAAAAKSRESPCDFAKYIQSVSHFPLVISYSHRCVHKLAAWTQVWAAPY